MARENSGCVISFDQTTVTVNASLDTEGAVTDEISGLTASKRKPLVSPSSSSLATNSNWKDFVVALPMLAVKSTGNSTVVGLTNVS